MANDLNTVALTARLTRDPELRHTSGGTPVASLRVAFNDSEKDRDGQWVDRGNFIDVTVWGRQAEVATEYLAKGRRIALKGRLRHEEWEASDGSGKRSAIKLVAESVVFLDYAEDDGRERQTSAYQAPRAATPADDVPLTAPVDDVDEIPFKWDDPYGLEPRWAVRWR